MTFISALPKPYKGTARGEVSSEPGISTVPEIEKNVRNERTEAKMKFIFALPKPYRGTARGEVSSEPGIFNISGGK